MKARVHPTQSVALEALDSEKTKRCAISFCRRGQRRPCFGPLLCPMAPKLPYQILALPLGFNLKCPDDPRAAPFSRHSLSFRSPSDIV